MQAISAAGLLSLGDAPSRGPFDRARRVLAITATDRDPETWQHEPLGLVARALLDTRSATLGDDLDALVDCARCHEPISIAVSVTDLVATPAPDRAATVEVVAGDSRAVVRMPTFDDLAAAGDDGEAADADAVRQRLFGACLVEATTGGTPTAATDLPGEVIDAAADRLDALDPLIDPAFGVTCPECGAEFDAAFDVASYVFGELAARGAALLYEVDALARRYGWTEAEILAMPAARRGRYLELSG